MTLTMKDITSAVFDALEDSTALTGASYHKFKNYRPLSLGGSTALKVPALSLAVRKLENKLMDTQLGYDRELHFFVTWYSGAVDSTLRGSISETTVNDALDLVNALIEEMTSWGSVPGLTPQHEVEVGNMSAGMIEGGVLTFEVELCVRYWNV